MAVVNFKTAMPSVGGSSAPAPASGSGSNTFRNVLIGLAVIGLGYWAYTHFSKSKQAADEDDN
jgi:hypothetical protein